jgi:hypothetical protein
VGSNDIWQVDPTGQFWQCHAAIIGRAADKARSHLLELIATHASSTTTSTDHEHHVPLSYLNDISTRQALVIARECIEQSLKKGNFLTPLSTKASSQLQQGNDNTQQLKPRLLALSIERSTSSQQQQEEDNDTSKQTPQTVQWYTEKDLYGFSDAV